MVKRDKNAHQSNYYKATHHGGGKPNKKSSGKGGKGNKSINKFLSVGKPGPHLLRHKKLQEAKKKAKREKTSSAAYAKRNFLDDLDDDDYDNYVDHSTNQSKKVNNKKAKKKKNMGGTDQHQKEQYHPTHGFASGSGSRSGPQHRHQFLDPIAHAGTIVDDNDDDYEQDLEYSYDPNLWQRPVKQRQPASDPAAPSRAYSLQDSLTPHPHEHPREQIPSHSSAPMQQPPLAWSAEQPLDRGGAIARKSSTAITTTNPHHDQGDDDFQQGTDYVSFNSNVETRTLKRHVQETRTTMDESQGQKRKRTIIHESRIENRAALSSTAVPQLCEEVKDQFSEQYPWMCRRYSTMASVPLMLTQEIKDLVAYLSPTDEENTIRRLVFRSIKRAILSLWPNAQVDIYGSYDTGLYLPTSDLDILVRKQDEVSQRNIRLLAGRLQKLGIATRVELVLYAKVPLIKFKERCSNIDVDISFNKPSGVDGAAVSKDFMDRTPGLKPLTILVKHFLMIRGLNEPYSGGLGSYGTMLMILSFLQRHPMVSTGLINPSENLGVLFIEFMELYGRHFNFKDVGMSVTDGGSYFPMPQMYDDSHYATGSDTGQGVRAQSNLKNVRIIMLDPLDPQNNVTKPAFKYPTVMSHFAKAYERLTAAVEIRHKDLLHGESALAGEVSLIDGILWVSQEIIDRREELKLVYMNRDMFMY